MTLNELNESQRQAVECCDSPSLVIAGAGSGKTRVLTYKIAYLIEQGMKPWNILALTFTNKAAREMRERISRQVGQQMASALWMGTFHSIFCRILRYECDKHGFTSRFTIYDAEDSKSLIRSIVKEMQLDEKKYKPSVVSSHISNAKNALVLPSAYRGNPSFINRDDAMNMSATAEIYERYWSKCRQSNAMDFDDILLYTWMLLRDNPEVAERYQERFQFVLVDEYQDTNYAQHQIIWLLTSKRQKVCVVGDDAQSIYSFRGANIDNILNFQQIYTGAKLFKLEQNYRSTQSIVAAANSLIQHNQHQIRKDVFSQNAQGTPVEICTAYSEVDESNIVARKVKAFHYDCNLMYSQIAILYRTNAQSRSLEEAFLKNNIPYRIYGGLSFYQRKEIKDVVAYFRLALNHNDLEALRRIINYPARGIGDTTLAKVMNKSTEMDVPAWEVLSMPEVLDVNNGTRTKLRGFVRMIETFSGYIQEYDALQSAKAIISESGLQNDIFKGNEPEDKSRQENLQELVDGIASFVSDRMEQGENAGMEDYLQEISLISDLDQDDQGQGDRLSLMTVHTAKGLEFGAVIVVGLEETLFPSQMSMDSPRQIEEERRLFYVAMTRAGKYLVLTHAKSRFRYGRMEYSDPSRFLSEIAPQHIRREGAPSHSPRNTSMHTGRTVAPPTFVRTPAAPQPQARHAPPPGFHKVTDSGTGPAAQSSPSEVAGLKVGSRIMHERFGMGVVEKLEGTGLDAKATVNFANAGMKQLLLRFAKFKVV